MFIPVGSRNSWEIFVVTPAMFSSIGQGPGEPIDFGDDKGHRPHGQPPRLSLGPGRLLFRRSAIVEIDRASGDTQPISELR
jgi:hypothetical protein